MNGLSNITVTQSNSAAGLISSLFAKWYTNKNNTLYQSIVSHPVFLLPAQLFNVAYLLNYHITNIRDLFNLSLDFIALQLDNFSNIINTNIIENYKSNIITTTYLMCDRNTFNYYDTLDTTKVFDNPQTLKYNFTRNIRQIYGISPYATAIKGVIQSSQSEEGE